MYMVKAFIIIYKVFFCRRLISFIHKLNVLNGYNNTQTYVLVSYKKIW